MRRCRLLFILILISYYAQAKGKVFHFPGDSLGLFEFSPSVNAIRLHAVEYSSLVAYPVSMYWLYTQWYQSYPQSRFHFFNDVDEWNQMDKAGHLMTAYSI